MIQLTSCLYLPLIQTTLNATDCPDDDDDNDDSDADANYANTEDPSRRNSAHDGSYPVSMKNVRDRCVSTNSAYNVRSARNESQVSMDLTLDGSACDREEMSKKGKKEMKGNKGKKDRQDRKGKSQSQSQPTLPPLGKTFLPLTSQLSSGSGPYTDNHSLVPLTKPKSKSKSKSGSYGIANSRSAPSSPVCLNSRGDLGCTTAPDSTLSSLKGFHKSDKNANKDIDITGEKEIQFVRNGDGNEEHMKNHIFASDVKLQDNGVRDDTSSDMSLPFSDSEVASGENDVNISDNSSAILITPDFESNTDVRKIHKKQILKKKKER